MDADGKEIPSVREEWELENAKLDEPYRLLEEHEIDPRIHQLVDHMGGLSHAFSLMPDMPIDLNDQLHSVRASVTPNVTSLTPEGPKEVGLDAQGEATADSLIVTAGVQSPNHVLMPEPVNLSKMHLSDNDQKTQLQQAERELLHFVGSTCKVAQPADLSGATKQPLLVGGSPNFNAREELERERESFTVEDAL